jgi:hypothetical protein
VGPPLNNITVPDLFSEDAGFLYCPGTSLLRFQIFNQAIYWRRGFVGDGGRGIQWDDYEEFLPPGLREIPDRCDAVQVRAAVPAAVLITKEKVPAQVTIATRSATELAQ